MPRPSYTEAQVEAMGARIRAAALGVFAREGYANFSLRRVAREMQLTAPALYRYVDSKEALVSELRAEGYRRLAAAFEAARHAAAVPGERVRALLSAYLRFAVDEPDLYRLMYELDQGEAPAPAWVREERRRAFGFALAAARDLVAAESLAVEPLELVHLWWAALHGLVGLDLANQLDMGCNFDTLVRPVIALLTNPECLRCTSA